LAKMVRKQVYIATEQERRLKELAQRRGLSEAELIREALDREFELGGGRAARIRLLDPQAWDEEKEFIERLIAQGPLEGERHWTREELYAERLNRYGLQG
jgi:hypothetical protein